VGRVANREDVGTGNEVFSGHFFSSCQDPHQLPPPHHHLQPEKKKNSSQTGFLEALFGQSIVGNAIVGRVLAAFGSGVANPLVGMMLTCQMVVFAIHNLSDRISLLGKDFLPGPFLLPVLLSFAGILRSAFFLLWSHLHCILGNVGGIPPE
jgi:hypothetical protein